MRQSSLRQSSFRVSAYFAPLFLLIACGWAFPASGQVSFFQPLTFPDCNADPSRLFVADFNGDGKPDLLCADGVLDLGNGDGTFKASTPVPASPPVGVSEVLAVADFNGDGKPDLLEETTNTFSVLLGNGDGTFQSPINTATGGTLGFLAASDLNGDGYADVVGVYGTLLYVFIGNGDGTFKPGVTYNLGTSPANGTVSLADFNGDGKTDVALNITGQEIVLLGNGDGTLQAAKTSTGFTYSPYGTAVGDFNGDGNLDLVISGDCPTCGSPVPGYILLGNGDGTFQAPTAISPSGGLFAAGDVNGDGKLDLVFAGAATDDRSSLTIPQIYLGNGDGTFSAPSSYVANFPVSATTTPPDGAVAIADFNLDGKLDVASSGGVLLGNGDGTFQGIPITMLSFQPVFAAAGNFENNGNPDVAVMASAQDNPPPPYNLYILHNNGAGQLSPLHSYSLTASGIATGFQILVGDLNGDGNLDLVVVVASVAMDGGYSVLLGNGDGSFQSPVFYPQNQSFQAATLVDVNSDQKLDLVEGGSNVPVGVSLGNGDGTFAATVTYSSLYPWENALITGDFNGDGKVDIGVSPPYDTSGTVMLYGNGDGTFQPAIIPVDLNSFTAWLTADFRNMGRADLFSGNQVALNNGDGTFTFLSALNYSGFPGSNINGNGKVDLLVPNAPQQGQGVSGCQTAVALGNGDGTFGALINVPPSGCYPFSSSYPIADMNGDTRPDIVFLWGNGVGVLLNTTPPGFALSASTLAPATVTAGNSATSTVSVAPTFGFNSTVSLSCTGLPSGGSCSFNPASVASSSGMSTLTITTASSTAAGTYPVQIQGTGASVVNNAAISLAVQAAPDFEIGPSSGTPASQTISAGQSAGFSLTLAPEGSFSGTVNLGCTITPSVTPAPTCSLSTSSVQVSGSAAQQVTVTVATTAAAAAGAPFISSRPGAVPLAVSFMMLLSVWLLLRGRRGLSLAAPLLLLAVVSSMMGCGGNGSSSHVVGTPSETYTATVTATSGSISHSSALQVIVR
jgi:hypothetical protein